MANDLELTDLAKFLLIAVVVVCPQAHTLPRVIFIVRGNFSKLSHNDATLAHITPTFERLSRHWANDSSLTFVEDYLSRTAFVSRNCFVLILST